VSVSTAWIHLRLSNQAGQRPNLFHRYFLFDFQHTMKGSNFDYDLHYIFGRGQTVPGESYNENKSATEPSVTANEKSNEIDHLDPNHGYSLSSANYASSPDDLAHNEEIDQLNEQFEVDDNEEVEIEEAEDSVSDNDQDSSPNYRPSERNSILSVRNLNSIFEFSFEGNLVCQN
jgi:cytoskeletal protein RodZ